jgi:hypothetical protein
MSTGSTLDGSLDRWRANGGAPVGSCGIGSGLEISTDLGDQGVRGSRPRSPRYTPRIRNSWNCLHFKWQGDRTSSRLAVLDQLDATTEL